MTFFTFSLHFALLLLGAALILCTVRLLLGPSFADQVVALDLATNITISLVAILAVLTGYYIFIDVVVALTLIIFLSTVAFAQYLEMRSIYPKKGNKHD